MESLSLALLGYQILLSNSFTNPDGVFFSTSPPRQNLSILHNTMIVE